MADPQPSFAELVAKFALKEWEECPVFPEDATLRDAFIHGYALGCGLGLGVSPNMPALAAKMQQSLVARGWITPPS